MAEGQLVLWCDYGAIRCPRVLSCRGTFLKISTSGQEACTGCQHPYYGHSLGPMDPLQPNFRRLAGVIELGVVASILQVERLWAMLTICDCTAPLISHLLLHAVPDPQPVPSHTVQPPAPLVLAPAQPVMDTFTNVPVPAGPGSAAQRCTESAADMPISISADYMSVLNFRDLGALTAIESADDDTLMQLTPVPHSTERSALLAAHNLEDGASLHVVYIYHGETSAMWATAPTAAPAGTASVATSISAPAAPLAAETNTTAEVMAYLHSNFAERLARIAHAGAAPYGSGYVVETHIIAICTSLGLNLNARTFTPVVVAGLSIGLDNVVVTAGHKPCTFAGVCTQMGRACEACRCLACHFQQHELSQWVPPTAEEREEEDALRCTFDLLLLITVAAAITLKYEPLKSMVGKALKVLLSN
ncbi:hypothetical protein C8R46DRAFT_1232348 [Mycena filopes]|nr:hypothetical protein C8R46DRAFT_1232348 [Mycena filopes]